MQFTAEKTGNIWGNDLRIVQFFITFFWGKAAKKGIPKVFELQNLSVKKDTQENEEAYKKKKEQIKE